MIQGALLGSPVGHSLGPVLHNAAFAFLEIEGIFQAIDVPAGTLQSFLTREGESFDYFSVTMPLKEEVLSLGFNADLRTLQTQSGNTLYRRNGQWNLTSTDGMGLVSALTHAGLIELRKVLILGAGGTARAVTGALDSIATEIHVLGRSSNRQEAIERAINNASFQYYDWSREIDFSLYDLVINATPAGASDELANFVKKNLESTLFDVNYKPWPTVLAQRWHDAGGQVINGLELLIYQGIEALEIVLDEKVDRPALAAHLRSVLKNST